MNAYSRQTELIHRGSGRKMSGHDRTTPDAAPVPAAVGAPEAAPEAMAQPTVQRHVESKGMPAVALCFIVSLLVPIVIKVGPLVLLPYRLFLLVMFVPLMIRLMSGQAGKMMIADWLVLASALWAVLALAANSSLSMIIEPAGIQVLEVFGAYLVGRVAVRSSDDFMRVVRLTFWVLVVLLPFGLIEGLTNNNILLSVIPNAIPDSNQGMRFGVFRAQAVFSHSIHYGVFASAVLGLTWYAYSVKRGAGHYLFRLPIIGASTGLSLSTGPLIAFNIQLILIAWEMITQPNPRRWAIFGWLGAIGFVLVDLVAERSPFHTIVARLALSQQSAYTRILIFEHGMNNVRANPIFGMGLDVFNWVRPSYLADSVDNFWLLLTMRYGVPCFAFLALAMYFTMRRAGQSTLVDPADRACRAAVLTTLGGLIIAGGTVDYWKALLSFFTFLIGTVAWIHTGGAKTAVKSQTADDLPARRSVSRRHGNRAGG